MRDQGAAQHGLFVASTANNWGDPALKKVKNSLVRENRLLIPLCLGISLCASLLLAACGTSNNAESNEPLGSGFTPPPLGEAIPRAQLIGPIPDDAGPKGHALWDSWYDLSELGYVEEEYFITGTARSATGGEDAEYTTRFIMRRPADAADFNGTVFMDWVNVTAQFENSVDTLHSHDFLVEEGYAFVHLSMQAVGICCNPLTPQTWDPQRYADLNHPGDDYSFDMLAQIAEAIRNPVDIDAMDGLDVERIIVTGQSQSAGKLKDYVDGGFAAVGAVDAILIHSDVSGHVFNDNPPVPVLLLQSDFEANPPEPAATENFRLWEIAGTAHQDFNVGYHQVVGQGPRASSSAPQQPASADEDLHEIAGNYGEQPHPLLGTCILAGAAFPMRYSTNAAIHYLNRWATDGTEPPEAPRYEFDDNGQLARDQNQNALGGIRLPPIEVPVARYRSTDCALGGITIPFTEAELTAAYGDHATYFCMMQEAANQSVADGFLLPRDAADLMERVEAAANRFVIAGERNCQ